ncbi:MAG: DUF305 domain-containing protein [Actinomycetota bacterium]|nr:DUF305 domain-containing protein [Actinomycetota bacterium]
MAWMGHPTDGRMPGMATPEQIDRLRDAPPGKADAMFLRLMIPHHEAAIPIAEAIVRGTDLRSSSSPGRSSHRSVRR